MRKPPKKSRHDYWKVGAGALLLFGLMGVCCKSISSNEPALAICLLSIFVGILYFFMPSEVSDESENNKANIKNSNDMFWQEKPTMLQYVVTIATILLLLWFVAYIAAFVLAVFSPEYPANPLEVMKGFVSSIFS